MTPALTELVALLQGQLEQIVRLYDDGQSVVQLAGKLYHAKEIASAGIEAITAWNTRATQPARDSGLGEDAARYRGLRAQNSNTEDINAWTVTGCDFTDQEGPSQYWVGADLDAAIDAALSSQPEGEKS